MEFIIKEKLDTIRKKIWCNSSAWSHARPHIAKLHHPSLYSQRTADSHKHLFSREDKSLQIFHKITLFFSHSCKWSPKYWKITWKDQNLIWSKNLIFRIQLDDIPKTSRNIIATVVVSLFFRYSVKQQPKIRWDV